MHPKQAGLHLSTPDQAALYGSILPHTETEEFLSPLVGNEYVVSRFHHLLRMTEQERLLTSDIKARKSTLFAPSSPDLGVLRRVSWVMLLGDVGLGKTRLAQELAIEARKREWSVLWACASLQRRDTPYCLWTEILGQCQAQGIWESEKTEYPPLYYYLQQILPSLRDVFPALPKRVHPLEDETLWLFESTRMFLQTVCKNTMLLIVLDDLQWADRRSCELLIYLVRHLSGMPVIFLTTCRDGDLPAQHLLRSAFVDLQRELAIELLNVDPLSREQIRELLIPLPLADALVEQIQDYAAGNALFAKALADTALSNEGCSEKFSLKNPTHWPSSITTVFHEHLQRMSAPCRRLLEYGSALGGVFGFASIKAMICEDRANEDPLTNEDTILDLIEEALKAEILTEHVGEYITYHFRYPLMSTFLSSQLSEERRNNLHECAALIEGGAAFLRRAGALEAM